MESGQSGKKIEGLGVVGAHNPKISFVKGRYDRLVQTFRDRDNRRVSSIKTNIGVDLNQFSIRAQSVVVSDSTMIWPCAIALYSNTSAPKSSCRLISQPASAITNAVVTSGPG